MESRSLVQPSGQLFVIATPIGNLGDLTRRAEETLRKIDVLLCEDTRRSAKLLSALGIEGLRLERWDAHADARRLEQVLKHLGDGLRVGLVSDAGTPGISDPGAMLVRAVREHGFGVVAIPGVSSVATLLSVAGFVEAEFEFHAFFPRKAQEQKELLARISAHSNTRIAVWLESPERLEDTLRVLAECSESSRILEVAAGKELTKLHEKVIFGTPHEVLQTVVEEFKQEGVRGEWILAVRFAPALREEVGEQHWKNALECLRIAGVSASESARVVSRVFDVGRNEVYGFAQQQGGEKKFSKRD